MENKKIAYVLLGSALVLSGIILYRRNGRLTALNSDGYPLKINTKKIVWDNGIMPSGVYDNGIQKYSVSIITDTNAATSGHANITYNLLISGIMGNSQASSNLLTHEKNAPQHQAMICTGRLSIR